MTVPDKGQMLMRVYWLGFVLIEPVLTNFTMAF